MICTAFKIHNILQRHVCVMCFSLFFHYYSYASENDTSFMCLAITRIYLQHLPSRIRVLAACMNIDMTLCIERLLQKNVQRRLLSCHTNKRVDWNLPTGCNAMLVILFHSVSHISLDLVQILPGRKDITELIK